MFALLMEVAVMLLVLEAASSRQVSRVGPWDLQRIVRAPQRCNNTRLALAQKPPLRENTEKAFGEH